MKRRIALILGTFVVLLAAFQVYRLVASGGWERPWRYRAPAGKPAGKPTTLPGVGVVFPGTRPELLDYDKNHVLRARYVAETWEKVGKMLHLRSPRVHWYLQGGETVVIDADRGRVMPTVVGSRWTFPHGELEGNVRVVVDRNRDPRRRPLAERPQDAVRIHLRRASFDRDRLLIWSEERVDAFTKEFDLVGKGLRLAWNEAPEVQLRELRIERGEWMCIREGQDRLLGQMRLPGSGRDGGADDAAPPAPASQPGDIETYEAVFTDDVEVTYADQYLKGADELRLVFEFERSRLDKLGDEREASDASATRRAGSPTEEASTRPPGATAPEKKPLIVTWRGPLAVKPLPEPPTAAGKRFDVFGKGAAVKLGDERSVATCRRFEFRSPPQRGELVGSTDDPVRLHMADGTRISVARIGFDRKTERVGMIGPGTMHLPAGTGQVAVGSGRDEELSINWSKRVDVLLARKTVNGETGPEEFDFIRKATFFGNVRVRQGKARTMRAEEFAVTFHEPDRPGAPTRPDELSGAGAVALVDTETGEFVRAEKLDVLMSPPAEPKSYPRRVIAKGKVSARQRQTDLAADELTVSFARERDPKTGEVRAAPQKLDASGSVKITDRSGSSPVTAEAETLSSNLLAKTATLAGKPARIVEKDRTIQGELIFMDEPADSASVTGPGKLRFYTDQDLSGNKADEPVPVEVTWEKGLEYSGPDRVAVFHQQVHLNMRGDSLSCEKSLRVLFAPPDEPAAGAKRPDLSMKKISMVMAEKNVLLESVRTDEKEFLLRRSSLRSDELVFHAAVNRLSCNRPGWLLLEDYRQPKPPAAGERRTMLPSEDVDRPSQTLFRWSKSMSMQESGKEFVVSMAGKVMMMHRTGSELVRKAKLPVRAWPALASGRHTVLNCGNLTARFARAAPAPAPEAGADGPRIGRLQMFDANTSVNLFDRAERVEVLCDRILYQRTRDVAIIDGAAGTSAAVTYLDKRENLPNTLRAPRIIWYPKTDSFRVMGGEVLGGRRSRSGL